MKSPSRPPLRPRNHRDVILKDPAYHRKVEIERRRQIRIQQSRQRANEAARVVRQRVEREQIRQFKKIGSTELEKYRDRKMQELTKLETEYQNALRDIGLGFEGVKEQKRFEKWKAEQAVLQRQVAEVRGEHAMKVEVHQRELKNKIHEERNNLRKCVKLSEDARAAEIRAKKGSQPQDGSAFTSAKVIEVDLTEFEDHSKHVRFADQGPRKNYEVRTFSKSPSDEKPGVEEAIREEMLRRKQNVEQMRIARNRGLSALKRAQMARQKVVITESFFNDSKDESIPEKHMMDEIDIGVVGKPQDSSESSSISLHANVIRLNPDEDIVIHQPQANSDSSETERNAKGFVIGQATAIPKTSRSVRPTAKKQQHDEDFIAKVLEGMDSMPGMDNVAVSLQVEEVSTFQSSSCTTLTSTSGQASSESSGLLMQERFLSNEWKQADVRGLISTMKRRKDKQLQGYIEKLLSMKRQEIEDLSVTETSNSTTTLTSSSSSLGSSRAEPNRSEFVSSTPASILTSSDGSHTSSVNKSVRFKVDSTDGSFVQPPTRALAVVGGGGVNAEEKRREILEQTKVSLEQIQTYYDEQRRRIEAELEKRRKKSKEHHPVSEGPLTPSSPSSSDLSHERGRRPSTSSVKDSSSGAELTAKKATVVTRRSTQRQVMLNKSSSSGTTTATSGSVATVELLQRLRSLELPSLQRPPPPQKWGTKALLTSADDLNTSADILKASELDSSASKSPSTAVSSVVLSSDFDEKLPSRTSLSSGSVSS